MGECSVDGNPLDGLCSLINDHVTAHGVVGVLIERLGWAVIVFALLWLVGRATRRFVNRGLRHSGADVQVIALVNNVVLAVMITIALLVALNAAGLSLGVLLTFGGVAGLAFGLAFQDMLRNVLAGIFLLIERPFRIGDHIVVGEQSGAVQNIQLRTTALRMVDGRLAILPNTAAFTTPVINETAFNLRRFTVTIKLPEHADLEAAMRAARVQLESTRYIVRKPPAVIQPELAEDRAILHCHYWLEYRQHEPTEIEADISRRLYTAITQLMENPNV